MRFMKKAVSTTLSMFMVISMTSTAFAQTPPHLLYGTEKTYGEESTQHKPLLQGTDEDDFANAGTQYAVLPKNDTFSFEKTSSNIDTSHNVTIEWQCPNPIPQGDKMALFWEQTTAKTEKFEYNKDYSVYPSEVQEKVAALSQSDYYTLSNVNEPFVIVVVTDYDLDYKWWWIYQVVDSWQAPSGSNVTDSASVPTNSVASAWASDAKGWWIQNVDGTYLTNTWYQSPESALWYYMGADGYMLTNTTTPDGYSVNADGVWVQ